MTTDTGLSPTDAAAFRVMAVIALLLGAVTLYFGISRAVDALSWRLASVDLDLVHPKDVAGASVDTVTFTTRSLGDAAAGLLASGFILGAVVFATVAVAIALFLWRLAQGSPFHRSLFATTLLAGAAMSIGGLLSAFLVGFGTMQVAFDLDPDGDTFVPGFELDPGVMAIGAVVLALAFAFRAGTRLQRETEGLV
jgi:hypothetical protein